MTKKGQFICQAPINPIYMDLKINQKFFKNSVVSGNFAKNVLRGGSWSRSISINRKWDSLEFSKSLNQSETTCLTYWRILNLLIKNDKFDRFLDVKIQGRVSGRGFPARKIWNNYAHFPLQKQSITINCNYTTIVVEFIRYE